MAIVSRFNVSNTSGITKCSTQRALESSILSCDKRDSQIDTMSLQRLAKQKAAAVKSIVIARSA